MADGAASSVVAAVVGLASLAVVTGAVGMAVAVGPSGVGSAEVSQAASVATAKDSAATTANRLQALNSLVVSVFCMLGVSYPPV